MEATKRPWAVGVKDQFMGHYSEPIFVIDADGQRVAKCETPEQAALIVKAVNCHEEFKAVCNDIRGFLKANGYDTRLVDAILAKAE